MSENELNDNRPKRERNTKRSKNDDLLAQLSKSKKSGTILRQNIDVPDVYTLVDDKEYNKLKNERRADCFIEGDSDGYYDDGDEIFYEKDEPIKEKLSKPTKRKAKEINSNINGKLRKLDNVVIRTNKNKPQNELDSQKSQLLVEDFMKLIDSQTTAISNPIVQSSSNRFKMQSQKPKFSLESPKLDFNSKIMEKIEKVEKTNEEKSVKPLESFSKPIKSIVEVNPKSKFEPVDAVKAECIVKPQLKSMESLNSNDAASLLDGIDFEEEAEVIKSTDKTIDIWEDSSIKSSEVTEDITKKLQDSFINCTSEESAIEGQAKQFYWIDAYNDFKIPGIIYLFGKMFDRTTKSFISCCISIEDVERRLYFLIREGYNESDVYSEVDLLFRKMKIPEFRCKKVTKKYSFQLSHIPDEGDYLMVQYNAKYPTLASDMAMGTSFAHVFGINTNYLETFILDVKLKGPCWLDVYNTEEIKKISNCQLNYRISGVKNVKLHNSELPIPPINVVSLSIRTSYNDKSNCNEIIAIGCLIHRQMDFTQPPPNPIFQEHFTILCAPKQSIIPYDFNAKLKAGEVSPNYTKTVLVESCERSLINAFFAKLTLLDPDLLVCHGLLTHHIDLLLRRCQALNISTWDKLGRLRRNLTLPKLTYRNASWVARMVSAGRLLCDVEITARELIKSRNYELVNLCEQVLNKDQCDRFIPAVTQQILCQNDLSPYFSNTASTKLIIDATMGETFASLNLMLVLQMVPLALQITSICGNLLARTLTSGKSERIEHLLLHAFSADNYICPDKESSNLQLAADYTVDDSESKPNNKANYLGGLVLEPKKGLYNTYILLMDFNSLYPSIIQEYNICFTTIDRHQYLKSMGKSSADDETKMNIELAQLSEQAQKLPQGILPIQIKNLVDARRVVKNQLANSKLSSSVKQQLDIKQKALKITANSMYGCLGFASSRFQAKQLAALITCFGRNALMKTKQLIESGAIKSSNPQNNQPIYLDIVYGDTDSVMINTGLNKPSDYPLVMELANKVKREVNKCYNKIELDIDGVFRKLLMLKKKKYAALVVLNNNKTKKELKGLDIVRRDWCKLAVDVGEKIVDVVLESNADEEGLVPIVRNILNKVAKDLADGSIGRDQFVITKSLTKDPESYGQSGTNQAHVQVALRHNTQCKVTGGRRLRGKDCVEYVVCKDKELATTSAAQKAFALRELTDKGLEIDVEYYLAHQLHPVVSRLLEVIDVLNPAVIAEFLGMDPTKYQSRLGLLTEAAPLEDADEDEPCAEADPSGSSNLYSGCKPLVVHCIHCDTSVELTQPLYPSNPPIQCSNCSKSVLNLQQSSSQSKLSLALDDAMRSLFNEYLSGQAKCTSCSFSCRDVRSTCFGMIRYAKFGVSPDQFCNNCNSPMQLIGCTFQQIFNQIRYYKYLLVNPINALHTNNDKFYKKYCDKINTQINRYFTKLPGTTIELNSMPFHHILSARSI